MYIKGYIVIYLYIYIHIFKYYYLIGFGLRCNSVYCYIKHLFNTYVVVYTIVIFPFTIIKNNRI